MAPEPQGAGAGGAGGSGAGPGAGRPSRRRSRRRRAGCAVARPVDAEARWSRWRSPSISARGVSYWPGDATHPAAIVFMTNTRMWQVNAATGQLVTTFGENGSIAVGQGWGGTPTIYRNVAVIGAGGTEIPMGNQSSNPRAFDLATGKKLWEFQTVPKKGQPFNETWGAGAANGAERTVVVNGKEVVQVRGGTNWWGLAAPIDTERGVIYLPIAGPAANYYGGDRPGANVFGNSIVAVDLETGQISLALPDGAPRSVGHRPAVVRCAHRRRAGREAFAGDRARGQEQLLLRAQSRQRQSADQGRGASGAEGRRARRVLPPDAAVPGEARAAQPDQLHHGHSHPARRDDDRPAGRHDAGTCGRVP